MRSSAVQAFKLLSSKIHPQLPLSPRESEQLLQLLTSSFNRHLDREHASQTTTSPRTTPPSAAPSRDAPSSISSTHKHIEYILNNPLFSTKRSVPKSNRTSNHGDTRLFILNPLLWFEHQVAAGNASVRKAASCLENLKVYRQTQSNPPPGDAEAGQKILSWLWSSGAASSKDFVTNIPFVLELSDRLIAEGHKDVLWRWFNTDTIELKTKFGTDDRTIYHWKGLLLRRLILRRMSESPRNAVEDFLGALKSTTTPVRSRGSVYGKAGTLIVDRILANTGAPLLDVDLYDRFVSHTSDWSSHSREMESFLALHHPSKPDASPALKNLQQGAIQIDNSRPRLRAKIIQLCLETARQLIIDEKHSDAQWVLEFAGRTFPEELGSTVRNNRRESNSEQERQQKEAESLESLEALSLA